MRPAPRLEIFGVEGVGEVRPGDDLAGFLSGAGLLDGDVIVVTSKIVSKAEGRLQRGTREEALPAETDRVVARRGPTTIARTRHGLVMAAAGIDASNVEEGTLVLLPLDPDASARGLRRALRERYAVNVAVVVSDTSGRAWRNGQTDIAIGAAGLTVLDDHAGRLDEHGNELFVTAPALADEVTGAADLVQGKLTGIPLAVLRGLAASVLAPDDDGPGAVALVRPEQEDLFGYGAREAVHQALAPGDRRGFGAAGTSAEVAAAVTDSLGLTVAPVEPAEDQCLEVALSAAAVADAWAAGREHARLEALLTAYSWRIDTDVEARSGAPTVRIRPASP